MKPHQNTIPHEAMTTSTEVVQWVGELERLHTRIAPHFARPEPRRRALAYLQGIMSGTERKNGWQLAEHAREETPYGMQRLLSQSVWDDGLVREDLRNYVYEHLGTELAILVIDETSFLKRGEKSAGVQVQHCGTTGRQENCQVAVFLDYVTDLGHTLIDCELYIPESWIDDAPRCREAGIPDAVRFQTKCELARRMVERVHKEQSPILWVVADTVYGNNLDLRNWLEAIGYFFVLAVACTEVVGIVTPDGRYRQVEVREVEALRLHAQDWQRLSMGDGTKGPRLFDWACVPVLHRWVDDGKHWLLIRRRTDDPSEKTYYFVFGPNGTTLQEMVKAIGKRWRIEDDFKTSKGLGLDHSEVRGFTGWYRHITLVMLAHAFLVVICAESQKTTGIGASPANIPSSVTVVDASPPLLTPDGLPLISPPKSSPSLPAPPAFTSSPLQAHSTTPLVSPKVPSLLSQIEVSPSLPVAHIPPLISAPSASPPPVCSCPAPLTVPEVRHLLGSLIWPTSTNAKLVLAWSWWRRRHRGMASSYHTRARLKAG
jgi:SRSO17 transposase